MCHTFNYDAILIKYSFQNIAVRAYFVRSWLIIEYANCISIIIHNPGHHVHMLVALIPFTIVYRVAMCVITGLESSLS